MRGFTGDAVTKPVTAETDGLVTRNRLDAGKFSSTQRVFDAVCDLHAQEQIATRETVAELTGLKLTVVDDRLRALVDNEKLKRVLRGVYVPMEVHPPARPMSKTILPNGFVKVEIGDELLTLTPREDRTLAQLMAGSLVVATHIASERRLLDVLAGMATPG